jgi:hypothetical protein
MRKCNNAGKQKDTKTRQRYTFEELKIRHGVNQQPYFNV